MEALEILGRKVNALLKKYSMLQAEHESLQQTNARQADRIAELTHQLDEMKAQLLGADIARTLPDEEKELTRKQLDAVIQEIDKVLTNLNE